MSNQTTIFENLIEITIRKKKEDYFLITQDGLTILGVQNFLGQIFLIVFSIIAGTILTDNQCISSQSASMMGFSGNLLLFFGSFSFLMVILFSIGRYIVIRKFKKGEKIEVH